MTMEEDSSCFKIVIDEHLNKIPHGIKVIKWNNRYYLWIWHSNYIDIIEQPTLSLREISDNNQELNCIQPTSNEIRLKGNIMDIFQVGSDSVHALDSQGYLYSFSYSESIDSSPVGSMEVDLFSSSPTNDNSFKWKENEVSRVINCEEVYSVCKLNNGLAILTIEEKHPTIQIYSLPEFKFRSALHLDKHSYQGAVVSSYNIKLLSPSLKKYFQEKNELLLDIEVVLIGLSSGVVLWCYINNNSVIKGPFFLCSLLDKVQRIYWLNDLESNLATLLLIVLSSGPVIIFGLQTNNEEHTPTTLYMPDAVKTSWLCGNNLISSNLVDCFVSELKYEGKITMSSTSLPVKGVTAITKAPDSDDLIVTTKHSVYIMGPQGLSFNFSSPHFVIPDQCLLDNLFAQTQELDDVYKQMHNEEETLKALSTSIIAQNIPNLFKATIKVTADSAFTVTIQLTNADLSFSCEIWYINTEVCTTNGHKESISTRMRENFNSERDLKFICSHELKIGSIVLIELIAFLGSGQPVSILPVEKVYIDACHLMVLDKVLDPVIPKNEQILGEILKSWNADKVKEIEHECTLFLKVPDAIPLASCLQLVLQDSQERIILDEWNKISEFKKHNAHVRIQNTPVFLDLNLESKELSMTSLDLQLCHEVKKAVVKRFDQKSSRESISEELSLEIQAAYQIMEIETLKDDKEFSSMLQIKNNLRSTISKHVDSL